MRKKSTDVDVPPDLESQYQLAYQQLKRLAHHRMKQERAAHTFSTTDLVHEAYLKMAGQDKQDFDNHGHFLALASQAMRRILVDYARQQKRQKRGGDLLAITLNEELLSIQTTCEDVLTIDEALTRYRNLSERGAKIIEYWFFGGYKREEIANFLQVSPATIGREWRLARAWLSREVRRLKESA